MLIVGPSHLVVWPPRSFPAQLFLRLPGSHGYFISEPTESFFSSLLEVLVFHGKNRKQLLERRHLHKIVENEPWLFGENFNLSVSDQSLTEVLGKHLKVFGKSRKELAPVLLPGDRRSKIIDLMLSRTVFQEGSEDREHLIVELKRPTQPIDDKVSAQIKDYAYAVAYDERFKGTKTKWMFWVISNQITDKVKRDANRPGKPPDLLYDDLEGRIFIWVKTWAQIIESNRARLEFFRKQLDYKPEDRFALDYLHRLYERYLPPSIHDSLDN